MRSRWWTTTALVIAIPLAVSAAPGDVVTDYGENGRVPIESVTENVGVVDVTADFAGRAAVSVAGDAESGFGALVSADGSEVADLEFDSPSEVAFGPDGYLYVAGRSSGSAVVSRYDASGSLDASYGTGGTAELPVAGAIPTGVHVDSSGAVVVGGTLDDQQAWAVRLDSAGKVDSGFGRSGVVTLLTDDGGDSDFIVPVGVHAIDGGYMAVILDASTSGDRARAVTFDRSGAELVIDLATADEIASVDSTSTADGGVTAVVHVDAGGDEHDFHVYRFLSNGRLDPDFDNPGLHDDDVSGPVHVVGLRTGDVAVAYNVGPDAAFAIRTVTPEGDEGPSLATGLDAWMYGVAAVAHDGSLILAVDETPTQSVEPDSLALVKVSADESGRFIDDDGSIHEGNIEEAARLDITRGCNPPANTEFCPRDSITRGQMAAFLVRALDLPAGDEDAFVDDADSIFERDINALAAARITRGCNPPDNNRFCPTDNVTRGQMAAFLVRALDLPASDVDHFDDDAGSIFERDINALAAAGITRGCNPPDNDRFCPNDPVTREQMASFLVRALRDS